MYAVKLKEIEFAPYIASLDGDVRILAYAIDANIDRPNHHLILS